LAESSSEQNGAPQAVSSSPEIETNNGSNNICSPQGPTANALPNSNQALENVFSKERNYSYRYRTVAVTVDKKKEYVHNVPEQYDLVHKTQKSRLENSRNKLKTITEGAKTLDKARYCGSSLLSKRMYAGAMALAPGLSLTGAEMFIPMIAAAIQWIRNRFSFKIWRIFANHFQARGS
jgi:hypothetical protein